MPSVENRFQFEAAYLSDVGSVRSVNEDSVFVDSDSCLWLVADGMGGHAAGDYASQTIVSSMSGIGIAVSRDDLMNRFVDRLSKANTKIHDYAEEMGRGAIGSTVAAIAAWETRFACFWSGDSRVYRLRRSELQQLTKDHTEVQALLDAAVITEEQAENWPRKNVITQAVGVSKDLSYDVVEGNLADGDLFLLCSDGLTEYFDNAEIEQILSEPDTELDALCVRLVGLAIERGGKDNVSVVIVRCLELPPPQPGVDGVYPEFSGLL